MESTNRLTGVGRSVDWSQPIKGMLPTIDYNGTLHRKHRHFYSIGMALYTQMFHLIYIYVRTFYTKKFGGFKEIPYFCTENAFYKEHLRMENVFCKKQIPVKSVF